MRNSVIADESQTLCEIVVLQIGRLDELYPLPEAVEN
jgi:hypothetical protein